MKIRIDARNQAIHDLSQQFHSYYLPKIKQKLEGNATPETQTEQLLSEGSPTNHTTSTERSPILQESSINLTNDIKVFENCMPKLLCLPADVFNRTKSQLSLNDSSFQMKSTRSTRSGAMRNVVHFITIIR